MTPQWPLAAIMSADMAVLLDAPGVIRSWTRANGSPLHIVMPQTAARNARMWNAAAGNIYEGCDIRFALKSCKSSSMVKAFGLSGIGADVSSIEELTRAISGYIPPSRISFTGPDKTQHDHLICLTMGINLHIDNPNELERLLDMADRMKTAPRVTLRLQPTGDGVSRFGMGAAEIRDCALRLKQRNIPLEGLAFHLNGYGIARRIEAASECLSLMKALAQDNIACRSLDIGGGFPMHYMESESIGAVDMLPRWGDASQRGDYPYDAVPAGKDAMGEIVSGLLARGDNRRFLDALKIAIVMQPGRALLDQCGMTAFRVIGQKIPPRGLPLLVLDGMSFSLSETWFGADFLPAPVLINAYGRLDCSGGRFALAGRSCLESDFIRRIAVDFDTAPEAGDLIVFLNTAGYQMDSNESEFHQRPLPAKIAAMRGQDGWRHHRDDIFSVEDFHHAHHPDQ